MFGGPSGGWNFGRGSGGGLSKLSLIGAGAGLGGRKWYWGHSSPRVWFLPIFMPGFGGWGGGWGHHHYGYGPGYGYNYGQYRPGMVASNSNESDPSLMNANGTLFGQYGDPVVSEVDSEMEFVDPEPGLSAFLTLNMFALSDAIIKLVFGI